MSASHRVDYDEEDDYLRFSCQAPEDSPCHAVFECSCEYYDELDLDGGLWSHPPEGRDDDEVPRHTAFQDLSYCNYRVWITADDVRECYVGWEGSSFDFDGWRSGSVVVSWEPKLGCYVWDYAEEAS